MAPGVGSGDLASGLALSPCGYRMGELSMFSKDPSGDTS